MRTCTSSRKSPDEIAPFWMIWSIVKPNAPGSAGSEKISSRFLGKYGGIQMRISWRAERVVPVVCPDGFGPGFCQKEHRP